MYILFHLVGGWRRTILTLNYVANVITGWKILWIIMTSNSNDFSSNIDFSIQTIINLKINRWNLWQLTTVEEKRIFWSFSSVRRKWFLSSDPLSQPRSAGISSHGHALAYRSENLKIKKVEGGRGRRRYFVDRLINSWEGLAQHVSFSILYRKDNYNVS